MAGQGRKVFSDGDVLSAADVNGYLMDQSVMRFADSAARTAAIGTPTEGMVSYLDDTNDVEVYDGTGWVNFTGDITNVAAGTALAGGGSEGAVALDVVISDITTAQAGTALIADGENLNVDIAAVSTEQAGTALVADGTNLNVDYSAVGAGIELNATQINYTLTSSASSSYTLAAGDANKYLQFTNSATITVSTATDFATGDQVTIICDGALTTVTTDGATIAGAGTSTTSGSVESGGQYEAISILCVGSDSYRVIGNITAVG